MVYDEGFVVCLVRVLLQSSDSSLYIDLLSFTSEVADTCDNRKGVDTVNKTEL